LGERGRDILEVGEMTMMLPEGVMVVVVVATVSTVEMGVRDAVVVDVAVDVTVVVSL
jgi:branched-subunit amino acid transport protein AzlD